MSRGPSWEREARLEWHTGVALGWRPAAPDHWKGQANTSGLPRIFL